MMASFASVLLMIRAAPSLAAQQWKATISPSTTYNFDFFWNDCVGSGHGSLALREDWQQQLEYAHDRIGFTFVRFHGILDDDVGSDNGVDAYSFVNIGHTQSSLCLLFATYKFSLR